MACSRYDSSPPEAATCRMKGSERSSFSELRARNAMSRPRPSALASSKICMRPLTPWGCPIWARPYAALIRTKRSSVGLARSVLRTGIVSGDSRRRSAPSRGAAEQDVAVPVQDVLQERQGPRVLHLAQKLGCGAPLLAAGAARQHARERLGAGIVPWP